MAEDTQTAINDRVAKLEARVAELEDLLDDHRNGEDGLTTRHTA